MRVRKSLLGVPNQSGLFGITTHRSWDHLDKSKRETKDSLSTARTLEVELFAREDTLDVT